MQVSEPCGADLVPWPVMPILPHLGYDQDTKATTLRLSNLKCLHASMGGNRNCTVKAGPCMQATVISSTNSMLNFSS